MCEQQASLLISKPSCIIDNVCTALKMVLFSSLVRFSFGITGRIVESLKMEFCSCIR